MFFRITAISQLVHIQKKSAFIRQLHSYWLLKRQSRNGVPLLRRLQSAHAQAVHDSEVCHAFAPKLVACLLLQPMDHQSEQLREQLQYWQRLRQDLEKARLLVELIRKREKMKRENMQLHAVMALTTDINTTKRYIDLELCTSQ